MKHLTNRSASGLAWSMIILAGTVFVAPTSASAHEVKYAYGVNHGYYVHDRSARHFPRWLRARRDFQHWYHRSHYRYMRRLSWERLYDLYLYEKRRAGHHSRHYDHHGNRGYDDSHRHSRRRRG